MVSLRVHPAEIALGLNSRAVRLLPHHAPLLTGGELGI